jgi:hypothetical protein
VLNQSQQWRDFGSARLDQQLLGVSQFMASARHESSGVEVKFRDKALRKLTSTPDDGFGEKQGALCGSYFFNDEAAAPWPAKWGQSEVSAKGAQKVHSAPS